MTNEHELLIAALRHAESVGALLNEIASEVFHQDPSGLEPKFDKLHELLLRRFSDGSAVHLFIEADNLNIDLPDDLRGGIVAEHEF